MKLIAYEKTPFQVHFSFHRLINEIEMFVKDNSHSAAKRVYYEDLMERTRQVPELSVFVNEAIIAENRDLINELFEVLFPKGLQDNEIKAISMPFQSLMFNHTRRFRKIIDESGGNYDMEIRNFSAHQYYISCCCIIMNSYFDCDFDTSYPLFVDLPDSKGIIHHYRVLYNADFVEVFPTENALMLTREDIELLQDNYDDLDLWIKYFPQESWILRGFGIVSLVDVTVENALSLLKENFLKTELQREPIGSTLDQLFSSIFKVPNLKVGFTPLEFDRLIQIETRDIMALNSYLIDDDSREMVMSAQAYEKVVRQEEYYAISDVDKECLLPEEARMCKHLQRRGIKSCLFSPLVISSGIEGILEIVSDDTRAIHSVNSRKLNALLPIISETFERVKTDLLNHVEAIIQREFTTIHPSVYWKFLEEAKRNYVESVIEKDYYINPISFPDVFPLYGEIDIKGSSQLRNVAIIKDLVEQLELLMKILASAKLGLGTLILEKHSFRLTAYLRELQTSFYSGLERKIEHYIKEEIHPFLKKEEELFTVDLLKQYLSHIDVQFDIYYKYRKIFDVQVGRMNKCFSDVLDMRQKVVQQVFPHYYERFKTDGVEHNIYIGESICPQYSFDPTYLQNLRLWQLQVMSELMCTHYRNNVQEAIPMDVTVLVFVYDTSLGIQFRMDEKRFDIDGSYNTRYEIIKKRLDKAHVKDTDERIVQAKKITIVFVSTNDLEEYKTYLCFGQKQGLFTAEIDQFEVEDLQGVSGLTALRIGVNLDFNIDSFDYDNLMHNFLRDHYLE
ncbi:hypothetical protein VSO92_00695 [Myroides pelagicus]|uniref:hypothetical protein n=1 Tax=Myroides pelagicus TaxID=270914 RepID=UPI002DB80821|nr:hypothetical protein [Myroides pelagicus]MEC4112634.1 hypothetical protein [Myroides pelagicus]